MSIEISCTPCLGNFGNEFASAPLTYDSPQLMLSMSAFEDPSFVDVASLSAKYCERTFNSLNVHAEETESGTSTREPMSQITSQTRRKSRSSRSSDYRRSVARMREKVSCIRCRISHLECRPIDLEVPIPNSLLDGYLLINQSAGQNLSACHARDRRLNGWTWEFGADSLSQ